MHYVDLDGVIGDLVGHFCQTLGMPHIYSNPKMLGVYDFVKALNLQKEFDALSSEFWSTIPVMNRWLVQPNSVILTKGLNPASYAGKADWCRKHFPYNPFILVDGCKSIVAKSGDLLIDDYPVNCRNWELAGGRAVLFPQPWNYPCDSK